MLRKMRKKNLLRVSLEDFDGLLHSFQGLFQSFPLLGHVLWFSKGFRDGRVLVDLRVELELELILGSLNEEEADRFGNGVSHVPD